MVRVGLVPYIEVNRLRREKLIEGIEADVSDQRHDPDQECTQRYPNFAGAS